MKSIVFLIKGDPFSWKTHEAVRVGLALAINSEVYLVFIRDGVYALSRWSPEDLQIYGFEKLLENIEYVNAKLVVEDSSAEERGLKPKDFIKEPIFMSVEDISKLIDQAGAVLVW
ncbi:DsrE family protein [Thermocrinis minervae]|uniref:tRNA 2-thiouridine synthesizing protein C n=1 Tax=Thermocrinis minervae TaxID=381751 RepID=A0A1M6RT24_9AQUI|nr:DsrE family protein [Thermocrinis minervae]SHK35570.1 tRNA 2-thiouridine synthesizing protein C [Thermocrinis minervae]